MATGRHAPLVRDYRKLEVWHRADDLVAATYRVVERLPSDERFGLVSQMRRASVSIAANIAEGAGRDTDADFERFLSMAAGSCSELQYYLELVQREWPAITAIQPMLAQAHEVKRMLNALQRTSRERRAT